MGDSGDLSELQLAIMQVLWARKEASAADVQQALASRDLAITTVSTLLTRLEKRGVVGHRSEGRAFLYHAAVEERDVRKSMLRSLVDSLFSGDPATLMSHMLNADELSEGDLARMETLIAARRKAPRGRRG